MGRRGRAADRDRASVTARVPPRPDLPSADSFETLVRWRRDVRRFKPDAVVPELLTRLLGVADLAPSVGNSQPWRIVRVESAGLRAAARASFEAANAAAREGYDGERRVQYQALKLAGFDAAPVHLAVFCDPDPAQGHGLGRQTQAETLDHSCAGMVTVLWLAARTHGLGLGWVSILDPAELTRRLDVPGEWRFIGYVLMGYPVEEHEDPELARAGWQARTGAAGRLIVR